ncbi:threonylcarbamoyladenosine tRNA methylthiotransferase MtaB [bacterium BMS3Abin10]|nr:threonylcarbamoyladenosine tRNA methylthiotransferase MtaB [bacterium BMS3Abin10]HDK17139.1 tRNA (N(6)-L-threonylcarbamoyladenosine(37)-C(2))-methylthiotransferase MtaB [Nitrospirota bacterium]
MKIAIKTLGCKVNQSESSLIMGRLKENGHDIVRTLKDNLDTSRDRPDICIINTCTVTAKSDYQSRQMIRRAVKTGAKVVATGCYAQLRPDELSKIKGLDLILGNEQKSRIHEYLPKLMEKNPDEPVTVVLTAPAEMPTGKACLLSGSYAAGMQAGSYVSDRARAFLKIQDGCDFSCSYCAVPMARGKSRSLPEERVLTEAEKFVKMGYKEIVITGIHIGCYGLDLKPESSLLTIVSKIAGRNPLTRFRLSSIEPQEFQKGFLSMIKQVGIARSQGNICPHVHIPLQSGSDNILKAMDRRYTASFFKELINDIALECPDISIGTDVIAGFPGETEEDFKQTKHLLESLPISYMHVFPYSQRPGTKAASMSGQINGGIRKKRARVLLEIAKKKKNAYMAKHLGRILNVLVERKEPTGGFYRAISDNYIRSLVRADNLIAGQIVRVKACSLANEELICETIPVHG